MYKVIMKKERESFFRLLDLSVIIHAIGDTTVSTFCIEIRDALGYNNFSSSSNLEELKKIKIKNNDLKKLK